MKVVQQTPATSRRYRFWQDEPNPMGNTDLCLKGIKKENLSWLPIEKVPVTEYLPFNSLKQPLLTPYLRVQWRGRYDGEGSILFRFLKKHRDEMGYVLIHKDDFHGIIGVGTDEDYYTAGLATVFNARETDWQDAPSRCKETLVYPSVPIIMTSLKKKITSICYSPDKWAYKHDIDNREIDGCSYDDD